jgi:hypothetical protein
VIVRRVEEEREKADRMDHPFEYTTRARHDIAPAEVEGFTSVGVHRLILDVGSKAYDGLSTVVSRIERIGRELAAVQ